MVDISGPSQSAPRATRFASDVCDLVTLPIYLGSLFGLLLLAVPESFRNLLLVVLNIGWLIFRDAVFSPGRSKAWRKNINISGIVLSAVGILVSVSAKAPAFAPMALSIWVALSIIAFLSDKDVNHQNLKLVSLTGDKVTLAQAFIRNVLIIIPFILLAGYLIEIVMVYRKGDRLADSWAKTKVVLA